MMETCLVEKETHVQGSGGNINVSMKPQSSPCKDDRKPCLEPLVGKESPAKPQEEAIEPDEDAHSKVGSDSGADVMSSRDLESPLTVTSVATDEMLTTDVIEEQKKLEKKEAKKEAVEMEKGRELWSHMDNETKEERYRRLQCLLMKSNMYTEYLLQRMESQREEEKRKRERMLQRQAKLKAAQEAASAAEKTSSVEESETKDNTPELRSTKADSVASPTASDVLSSPKPLSTDSMSQASSANTPRPTRSRSTLRAPVPKSHLSAHGSPAIGSASPQSVDNQPKTDTPSPDASRSDSGRLSRKEEPMNEGDDLGSQKENTPMGPRRSSRSRASMDTQDSASRRGRKRKAQDSQDQSPQCMQPLTNFFKPASKKHKSDDTDSESMTRKPTLKNKKAEDTDDENEDGHAKDEEGVKKSKKSPAPRPLFEGKPIIGEDGSITKPALFTGGDLRSYQIEGLNWLKVLFENGVNGILADEMGLGKTIQCIAVIAQIITMGTTGPFMVVAPLSTLPNWMSEFKRFAPWIPVVFYHGAKGERALIRRKIRKRHQIMENVTIRPVVITSFEMAMIDRPHLHEFDWTYMIVDEGHRIKNKDCRLIRELKQYKNAHRILLTGTPLQNNLRELWSLLNFLLPEIFDDLGSFETWFDIEVISEQDADEAIIQAEKKENILGMLHQILTPFMLRRVKTDVDLCIPPKKELLVYAPLTSFQQEFYESTVDRTILQKIEAKNTPKEEVELSTAGRPKRWVAKKKIDYRLMMEDVKDSTVPANKQKDEEELESWVEAIMENSKPIQKKEKSKVSQVTIRLQNIMMQLRKCCNHPYLLEYPLDPVTGEYMMNEELVKKCGKMMLLDKMLIELKKRGHKVLLFSQMTKMLDILEDYCVLRGHGYCRLDGSCGVEDRQESMDSFNKDESKFLFLLSTRAGGLGINLTAADTVIIYDSDWNPQNDLQAQDRCHRIGQTKPVVVYRLVTANTIDQKIVERATAKRKLEKMIIHKGKFKSGIRNFSTEMKPLCPEELMELLKSRDYKSAMQEGNDTSVISKRDLNILLDRRDLVEEFERIQRGETQPKGNPSNMEFKTSAKESSKLFTMVDFDKGGSTLEKKEEGEANGPDTESSKTSA